MNDTLSRLVYHSANRIVAARLPSEVEAILAASRRNNDRVGVTGALMFTAGYFVQVLEGPAGAVEATFERIQSDARHGDVTLLAFGPVDARAFPNWSMAHVGAARDDGFSGIGARSGFDPRRLSADDVLGRLHRNLLDEEANAA